MNLRDATLPPAAADPGRPDVPGPEVLDAALRVERIRLFRENLASAVGAQGVSALLVLVVLWTSLPGARMAAWVAVFAAAIAWRVVVGWQVRGEPEAGAIPPASTLGRVRLALAGTGLAWGLAGTLLLPPAEAFAQRTFLTFVLAGLSAGALTLTAFDFPAALVFVALTLAPLALHLLVSPESPSVAMAAMVMLFIGILALTGWRVQRSVRSGLAARVTEAARAESLLRDQEDLRRLSAELSRQREALQLTFDSMDQGILSMAADGRASFHNHRLLELLELPETLLAARPTAEEIARWQSAQGHFGDGLERDPAGARGVLSDWLAGDPQPLPPSHFRRTPSGRVLEVKTRQLADGGMVHTFSDVTTFFDAQRQLQESEAQTRKLALVASHTDNAVIITDAERRIEWVNDAFTRMTGFTAAESSGRRTAELLRGPLTDQATVARLDDALLHDQRCHGELLLYRRSGQPFWFAAESHAVLDEHAGVRQYIGIGRDVTAAREAEQALRAARDEAELASRAKSEFLSAMSHELRTPMNAILGFAQLLDTDLAHPLAERQRAQVQQILRAGEHLLALINDVLDLARVESGKQQISLEPVAVAELVDDCLALVRPLAAEAAIALEGCEADSRGVWVVADRTRLRQVLLNLLSNAIKYNEAGGAVRMLCATQGAEVRIGVRDTGVGLAPEQRVRLFQAFERLGAEAGPVPGAGIGLALSKRLVELMHGDIDIDSAPGAGSTFWVRLGRAGVPQAVRADDGATPSASTAVTPDGDERRCHVLYIEDNPVNAMLMEAMLEREPGVRLVTAPMPALGLDLARADPPDLLLLDIQLPGMDGFEVLRRLRAHEDTRAIPVVAVSANAMQGDVERALSAGFDGYLTKPIDLEQLRALVRSHGAAAGAGPATGRRSSSASSP